MRRAGSRRAEHRVMRAAEHGRVAAAQRNPLIAGAGVDDGVGGATGDALSRDTADRFVAGAAAGNRVGRGAPDRLVAAATDPITGGRSEEQTSELQSHSFISIV